MRIHPIAAIGALVLSGASTAVMSQTAHVQSIEGKNLWAEYPDGIDKPTSRWEGSILYVRLIITSNNYEELESGLTPLSLDKAVLHLTYRMKPKASLPPIPGAPAPPGVIVAKLLEFKVEGLPRRDYQILISRSESREAPQTR